MPIIHSIILALIAFFFYRFRWFVNLFINLRLYSVFLSLRQPFRSHERTQEELELVFEELLHIAALSHLSTSIKRELASIIVFEAHAHAGTICEYLHLNIRIIFQFIRSIDACKQWAQQNQMQYYEMTAQTVIGD